MFGGLNFDIFASDKTGRAFDSVKGNINSLKSKFDGLGKSLGGLKGLIASVFAINYFKGVAEAAERINDLSNRLRINAEILSQYQVVAGETGVELDSIAKAMQQLGKNSIKAADGQGAASQALSKLGIDAKQFKELGMDRQFAVVAEAMQGITNPAERVNIAMALMGKSGAEMLQVMEGGGQALLEMQQRADELGVTLTKVEAENIDSMMDAFGNMGLAIKGAAQDLLAHFAPAIKVAANAITFVLVGAIDIFKLTLRSVIAGALRLLGSLIDGFSWLFDKLSALPGAAGEAFKSLSTSMGNYGDVLGNVKVETDDLFLAMKRQNSEIQKSDELLKQVQGTMSKGGGAKGAVKDNFSKVSERLAKAVPGQDADSHVQSYLDNMKKVESELTRTADRVEDRWTDALFGIGGGFEGLKDQALSDLKEIGASMLKDFLHSSTGGKIGGGGGTGFLSGMIGDIGNFIGGFFAEGGNFLGGKPIVVGERGAEVIMPKSGGTVIPNHAMGRPTTVNVNISTPDINGFRRSQGQIAATLAESVRRGGRNL